MKNALCLMFGSLTAISCADGGDTLDNKPSVEHAQLQAPALQRGVRPWAPGAALPIERDCSNEPGRAVLQAAWAPVESVSQMTSRSELVLRAHAIGRTYDAMRSYDNPKEGQPEIGSDGLLLHSDIPVTIVHFAVDEVVAAKPSAQQVHLIDALFAGGLTEDGCIVEPADNPLPRTNEQAILFAIHLGASQLVLTKDMSSVFGIVGGARGRVRVEYGKVVPASASGPGPDRGGLGRFLGGPVADLIAEVRRTSETSTTSPP